MGQQAQISFHKGMGCTTWWLWSTILCCTICMWKLLREQILKSSLCKKKICNYRWYLHSYDPTDVGNLFPGFSALSKFSLNIWKFSVHVLLKPSLENSEHYFAGLWGECNSSVVWTFFGTAFLWDWNESWPFPVLWPLLSFPNLLAYLVQHFHCIVF